MSMTSFPHHPHNHPSSPTLSPFSPTTALAHEIARCKYRAAARASLSSQLLAARTLIAQSRTLSDNEIVVPRLPLRSELPRMRAERKRPAALDLRSRKAERYEQWEMGLLSTVDIEMGERKADVRVGNEVVRGDVEKQYPTRVTERNMVIRFWNARSKRERMWLWVLLFVIMVLVCGVPFLVLAGVMD